MAGTDFAAAIAGWHDFYLMIGTAAATLIGLLFVAVSFHIDAIVQEDGAHIRVFEWQTFTAFIRILVLALVFLIPLPTPDSIGRALIVVGAISLFDTVQTVRLFERLRQLRQVGRVRYAVWRILVPLACNVGLIAIGVLVERSGDSGVLYWLVSIQLTLLVSAARSAWELLVGVAQRKARLAVAPGGAEVRT